MISTIRKLAEYARPYRRWLIFSFVMAFPLAALRVGPIPLVKFLVDDILVNRDASRLIWIPLATIGLYTLNLGIRFFHYYAIRVVVVRVNQDVREKIFKKLIHLSADHFSEKRAGALLSRVTADPQYLDQGIATLNAVIREPITFLVLLGYTLSVNWRLTLLTFTIVPALAYLFARLGKMIKVKIADYQELNAESYSTVQETIAGNRVVQLFNLQQLLSKKFSDQLERMSGTLLRISRMEELMSPGVELITSFAIALILYFGGKAVLDGQMSSGELIAFFTAFGMMINPIRQLSDTNSKIYSASAALDRIEDFLGWTNKVADPKEPYAVPGSIEEIEFEKVSFAYPESEQHRVLKDLQFKLQKGQTVALVGQSGSGKSSTIQLLARIYDPTRGEIRVNGIGLRNLNSHEWRNHLAVVSQDVFLFHDTIYNNILLGNPTASAADVEKATKQAHAWEFIQRLPQKMNTLVGDRGMKLSGGERQRISIARAFLKNAPILILDEATSNLDNESETLVQRSLEALMQQRTTLVIAHRLTTIEKADSILVLKEGQIIEQGTYSSLSQKDGEFSRLLRKEF